MSQHAAQEAIRTDDDSAQRTAHLLHRFVNRHFKEIHSTLLAASDGLMIFLGFMLAYWLRFSSGYFEVTDIIPSMQERLALIPWLVMLWILASPAFEIYLYRSGFTWTYLTIKVLEAVLVATAATLIANQIMGVRHSRLMLLLGWSLSLVLIGLARYLIHIIASILHSYQIGVKRVAIVGTDGPIDRMISSVGRHPEFGIELAGIVADDASPDTERLSLPLLGTTAELREVIKTNRIDELLIALPHSDREKTLQILSDFETDAVSVRIISSVIDKLARPVEVGEIAGMRILALRDHPLTGWQGAVKRMIDFTISGCALLLLFPLMAVIAAIIKLTSPGPILYRQVRVGRDDKPFNMYKFRSMRVDAEEKTGPVWARKNDDRRTKIGVFLRRTSLDELPQLYNIISGQMSLVGPRPERPEFVTKFKQQVPDYVRRHKVKAGLTGWAQMQGLRGNTPIEKRIESDLWYITNWSLSLDFEIILKTFIEIFRGRNAY